MPYVYRRCNAHLSNLIPEQPWSYVHERITAVEQFSPHRRTHCWRRAISTYLTTFRGLSLTLVTTTRTAKTAEAIDMLFVYGRVGRLAWAQTAFVANSKYKIHALFKDFQGPKLHFSSTKIIDKKPCPSRGHSKFRLQCDTRSTQPCIPPGSLNRVPASAVVRAGMSPLPGGR